MTSLVFTSLLAVSPTSFANPATDMSQQSQQQFELININQADIEQLVLLKGVGKKKAEAIVEFRQKNGDFTSVEELQNVKGIGINVIKDNIDRVVL